jgi:hypothetical protein
MTINPAQTQAERCTRTIEPHIMLWAISILPPLSC